MSVGSALGGKGKGAAIAISLPKPGLDDAMAEFHRAQTANDTKGMAAAFRMAFEACQDESGSSYKDDDDGEG